MNIQYFYEDIDFRISNEANLTKWISDIILSHGFHVSEVNYIFCSDNYLLEINKQHLNHNYFTDIITFNNSEQPDHIETDIFISIDRVKENANKLSEEVKHELHRVMIHGVLHLLGFDDKTPSEKKAMREKEDACLSLLKI